LTAEIALLNKLAVTLAADSAVSIPSSDGTKVYNSADKIFEATNHDPIGIMVYNSPEINGIPIESVVKMYRDRECATRHATVFDFATAFLSHLEKLETPEITVSANIQSLIWGKALAVQADIKSLTEEFFRNTSDLEQYDAIEDVLGALNSKFSGRLDGEIETLSSAPAQGWAEGLSEADVIAAHGDCLGDVVAIVFRDDQVDDDRRDRIVALLAWSLLKDYQQSQLTGLVFAGFGQEEIFPSLVCYEVYGVVAGKLKFVEKSKFDVDRKLTPDAAVMPFAQKEMVDRFMYGLDAEFLQITDTYFSGAHTALKQNLNQSLVDAPEEMKTAASTAVDAILAEFQTRIVPEHLQRLREEFSDMVRLMPKQELAALSESLVHTTSLKRKFSAAAESVGGPIDVAMITRAEGFVWVKRKHYFDPSLNPRFFFRRYGRASQAQPYLANDQQSAK
jgi:hypothetical protein